MIVWEKHLEETFEDISIDDQKPKRLPVVFTRDEVIKLFSLMSGVHLMMAKLLYGTGMRHLSCCACG